ncbi:MAG: toll/interleukin-1 receptor domain-containing protein [Muribaculaceae bacterium]|nr:toll/interleukin-1 receptor domain-containing protein [Muribaculaceae bacterium]
MIDIFISYSTKDKEKALLFVDYLEAHHFSVWIAEHCVFGGEEFYEAIANAIKECRMLVFFSSTDSNDSKWVRREICLADEQNKAILPVRLDNTAYHPSIQLVLSGLHYISANSVNDETLHELLTAVIGVIGERESRNCPVIDKPCPIEYEKKQPSFLDESISLLREYRTKSRNEFNSMERASIKYYLKCEGVMFSVLTEFIWLILIVGSLVGVYGLDELQPSLAWISGVVVAYFLSLYVSHLTTSSRFFPGWQNRNLTSHGALILALEFFVTTSCLGFSAYQHIGWIGAAGIISASFFGILGVVLVLKLNKVGYYALWADTLFMTLTCYTTLLKYNCANAIGILFCAEVVAMLILTIALMLREGEHISFWGAMFGKECLKTSTDSGIIRALYNIWYKFFN